MFWLTFFTNKLFEQQTIMKRLNFSACHHCDILSNQSHSWHWKNSGISRDLHPCRTQIALWHPANIALERPVLCGVWCVMLPSGFLRMRWILWGPCRCRLLLIFHRSFIFRSKAVMLLSSVLRPGTTLCILICLITGTLWLLRSIEPHVLLLWVESSSLARRPILPRKT